MKVSTENKVSVYISNAERLEWDEAAKTANHKSIPSWLRALARNSINESRLRRKTLHGGSLEDSLMAVAAEYDIGIDQLRSEVEGLLKSGHGKKS